MSSSETEIYQEKSRKSYISFSELLKREIVILKDQLIRDKRFRDWIVRKRLMPDIARKIRRKTRNEYSHKIRKMRRLLNRCEINFALLKAEYATYKPKLILKLRNPNSPSKYSLADTANENNAFRGIEGEDTDEDEDHVSAEAWIDGCWLIA